MKNFKVQVYPLNEGRFLVSFINPLTMRKERKNFNDREEANQYKNKIERQYKSKSIENYHQLTVEELILIVIQDNPKSYFTKKKTHLIDFVDTFGSLNLNQLTVASLKLWFDQIQQENGLKDITMRGLKCEIDTLFAYLVKRDVISVSPLKSLYYKDYVPTLKSRNILAPSEINELLEAVKDYSPGYLYPIIKFFAETACKTKELVDLQWEQVNLGKRTIHLREDSKSRERKIEISEELVKLISRKEKSKGHVFMTYYKEPFTTKKISRVVMEFKRKKLYHANWCPMDLRHSFAVNFLKQGEELKELQYLLGHYNVFETKRLYGEITKKKIIQDVTNPFELFKN